MKTAINHNTFKSCITTLAICCSLFVQAQILDAFESRLNETVKGDFCMIANNVLSRTATQNYNGTGSNHNFSDNVFVDIDNDNTTFNSSSANLVNPEPQLGCLSIYKAYLYWAAADREPSNDITSENQPNWNYNDVKLMLPGEMTYSTVTADEIVYRGRDRAIHIDNDPYICFKDITKNVQNLGSAYGTYQVANIEAKTGSLTGHDLQNIGTSGGWQIVFVYESPKLPSKNISLYDGYAQVTSTNNNFDILFDNFQTVPQGNVDADIIVGALEGDRDLGGDMLQIQNVSGVFEDISTPQRFSTNFFNSKITDRGIDFVNRNPASLNTLGFDAGIFNLNNPSNTIIANNQTSTTFRLTSNQETYGLYLLGLSVEVWSPELAPIDIVSDSGSNPAITGSSLGFSFDLFNRGNDNLENLTVSGTLPTQIVGITASNLPSGVTLNYDLITGEAIFSFQDGMFNVGDNSLEIEFDLQIQDSCYFLQTDCNLDFEFQFIASYTGVENPNIQTTPSSSFILDCNQGDLLPLQISIAQPEINWATAIGALDVLISCNNTDIIDEAQKLEPQTDQCDFTLTKTSGVFVPDNNCSSNGSFINTWTFTDACGVTIDDYIQTITIQDTKAPDITVPADVTLECSQNEDTDPSVTGFATGTNTCGTVEISFKDAVVNNCGNTTLIIRTWTATGNCGYTVSNTQNISIIDTTAPDVSNCSIENTTIPCANDNQALAADWNANNIATIQACATDSCDTDLEVVSDYDFNNLNRACGPCGTLNVTYTVTDDCENSATINVTLTFTDVTLPDLSNCSVIDQTVECSFNDIETISDNWNASNISSLENCTQTFNIIVTSNYDYDNLIQTCGQTGSVNVLYTLTDTCGNTTLFEATFTTEDTTGPVFDGTVDDLCVAEFINGSFEANTFDGAFAQLQQEDVPGWSTTAFHNTIEIQRSGQIDGSIPFDGNYHFELNGKALDDLYQEFCTVPASNLELSFYHKKRASSTAIDVLEVFIGADLNNLTSQGLFQVSDAEGWKQNIVTYTVPAGQDATIVLFQAISGTTNSVGNLLDAITVNSNNNNFGPLPVDITVECSEIPTALALTASDNCGEAVVTLEESIIPGSCTNQYTLVRTWTATDDCGNSISHTQNISVEDTTAPGFTQNPPPNTTVECDNIPNAPILFADDNCGSAAVTFEEVITQGNCLFEQTIIRTWTATDECGNTNLHVQTIIVEDTTAPIAPAAPDDIVLECVNDLPTNMDLTASDNCSGDLTVSPVIITEGNNPCNMTMTLTWTFTDDCNNSTELTQTITLSDTTAPTFTVPADITIECDVDVNDLFLTGDVADEADNCSTALEATFTDTIIEGNCDNAFIITRTWTLIDDCKNTTTLVQTITVEDTTDPVFIGTVCTTEAINSGFEANNFSGNSVQFLEDQVPGWSTTSTDNRIEIQKSGSIDGNISHSGGYHFELNGRNLDDLYQEVCSPSLGTLEITFFHKKRRNNDILNILELYAGSDVNNLTLIGTYQVDYASGWAENTITYNVPANQNSTVVLFRAIQGSSNSVGNLLDDITITADSDVIDDTLPEDITVECSEIPIPAVLNAFDACSEVTVTFEELITDGVCANSYTIIRTWTATDSCGNQLSHSQNISVEDTTAPTFTVPADVSLDCDTDLSDVSITGDVTDEADNCSADLEATFTDTMADGSCANETVVTRTWVLTDECDNTTTAIQTITVQDTTAPTFTVPADVSLECDTDLADVLITGDVTDEADNCSANLEAIFTDTMAAGSCANETVITRTWVLTDECDNTTTAVQTISIQDTTAPTFTVPADVSIECDTDLADISITGEVTDETDNCSTNLEASFTDTMADGSCANETIISRTWTLTDDCNNTTTAIQTITIQDTTAPAFTVPADVSLDCDTDLADVSITGDVTDEADNCSADLEATFTDTMADGSCANETVVTRTWVLTDECDNTTTAIQTITVQDTTAPTFTVPADVSLECDTDLADVLITGDVTDEADNCSANLEAIFTDTMAAGSCANETVITRTWVLTDECDNTTTAVQTISIQDTTAPTFTVPADVSLECDTDLADVSITGDVTDEADNCSIDLEASFTDAMTDGSCANETVIIRTWTLTDDCDNTTTAIQTITIEDTTAPIFTVPADVSLECDADLTDVSLTGDVTDETDNCSEGLEATFVDTTINGDCLNSSIVTRVWTVIDDCGNAAALIQIITIEDTTAPTFTLPESITIECDQDITDISNTGDVIDEADNCSTDIEATFTDIITEGDCANNFTIARTWSLTDDCDNTTTLVQTITVIDSTAPTLVGEFENVIDIACSDIPDVPNLVFEDTCSSNITVEFNETSTSDGTVSDYTIIRDWFVTDACANEAIFTQTINVTVATNIPVENEDLCIGEDFDFDLFNLLLGDYDPDGIWSVTTGNATIDGSFFNPISVLDVNGNYTADQLSDYEFTYTYAGFCPGEVTVIISLNDECIVLPCGQDDLVISKAVTANFDAVNEFFTITGTEDCGFVYELQIFNRWGAKIYDNPNYQNDWNGTTSSGSIGNSNFVPTGTYYYVLNLRNSGLQPVAGPIYVSTK
jgi:hypothetical protein